ncbi:MAG TPA: hypothetical protein VMS21_05335, partial [Methylomirabilota bacterium]|nr:hypothetical protein [Methylomirabilota bacterium]
MKTRFCSPLKRSPRILAAASVFALSLGTILGSPPLYFAHQEANAYLPVEGGVAPTAGGNIGASPQPIQSVDGTLILQQSALGAAVVAIPEGLADGYAYFVALGHASISEGTSYKQDQNGSTIPWDLRFPGVIQLTGPNSGQPWPADEPGNFDAAKLRGAAEYFRVAIRTDPFDLEARAGLLLTYVERMVARLFGGNNAAQYASRLRLFGGTIHSEIGYWENAIGHYGASGDIFAEATGLLPDAETFEAPLYADMVQDALEVFARGLAYEADAVRHWLQVSYFATYRDPLSATYNPASLLAALAPKLEHVQSLLFLASHFTHVPNFLELDFPSVNASLSFLTKQMNITIPRGMISFVGQRAAGNPGEVIGEYAPEFVPFLFRDDATSLPTSFDNLLKEATDFIGTSENADIVARDAERTFDTDRDRLIAALDQIFANYNTQLGDLCGLIFDDDGQLQPDVPGSLLEPGEREAERPFQSGESSGRIYQQYLAVNVTLLEVEAAEQDRRNIYLKAVNARTVGELIANQSENLAQ